MPLCVPEGALACYNLSMRALIQTSLLSTLTGPALTAPVFTGPTFIAPALFAALLLATPASAYVLLGASWNPDEGPIVFNLHPAGSDDISDRSDLAAVRTAFRSWACIPGSRLRILEGEEGPADLDLTDGFQTFFWDETGEFGLGPSTLGVAVGDAPMSPDSPITRFSADIVLNGFDSTWSTDGGAGVDIGSVAVHEIGHFFGLGHPCTDEAETDCLGPDQSVMTPSLPSGAIIRVPFEDDRNGMIAMYAQEEDDESGCDGPFRQGEPCACNNECVGGLKCTIGANQEVPVCTPNCGTSAALCPTGFSCVLAARPEGADNADGACVASDEGNPPASACERDSDCAQGICLASSIVGRRICQVSCDSEADCPADYACTEGLCTGGGASGGLSCPVLEPDPEPEEPGPCESNAVTGTAPPATLFFALFLPWLYRRRRAPSNSLA